MGCGVACTRTSLRRVMCIRSIKVCDFSAFRLSLREMQEVGGSSDRRTTSNQWRQEGITNKLGYGKRVNEMKVLGMKIGLSY